MSYFNEADTDAILYSKLPNATYDSNLNQLEMANAVRDYTTSETINCFAKYEPYTTVETIFNTFVYDWNIIFVNKLLDVLRLGTYLDTLTSKEKDLIDSYVDFKYNSSEPTEIMVSLDEYIGAL